MRRFPEGKMNSMVIYVRKERLVCRLLFEKCNSVTSYFPGGFGVIVGAAPRGNLMGGIETGHRGRHGAYMPFACEESLVASVMQGAGQSDVVSGINVSAPIGTTMPRGCLPRNDARPGGRTNSACGISMGETHTVPGKLVERRALVERSVVTPQVAPA